MQFCKQIKNQAICLLITIIWSKSIYCKKLLQKREQKIYTVPTSKELDIE